MMSFFSRPTLVPGTAASAQKPKRTLTRILPLMLVPGLMLFGSCKERQRDTTTEDNIRYRYDTLSANPAEPGYSHYASVDVSPMDMAYFPVDYPKFRMSSPRTPAPVARVIYSRPHLQNRRLFPEILKYDQPWRLGANEATELDLYRDVRIQGMNVKSGRYTIYAIPHPAQWSIVLNSNTDTWGLKQDSTLDVRKFTIPISTGHPSEEYFSLIFEKADKGANLVIAWDDVVARLPMEF